MSRARAALAANRPAAGSCFKQPYLAAVKIRAESRRGGLLRVLAGFASSRPRRIRFVRVRGSTKSMESLEAIFFAFHSGFGLGARIAQGCIPFSLDRDEQGSRWLNRAPTLCSPSNIASKTIVGLTSSMRGRGALPFDQQNWDAPARPRIKRNCRAFRRGSHSSDSSDGKLD